MVLKIRKTIIFFQLAAKYKEMKKSASDAMNLVKKQQEGGNSEVEELRNENEKLSQQIEDLNLQLLQQHIAKERFTLRDVIKRNDDVILGKQFRETPKVKRFSKKSRRRIIGIRNWNVGN